VSSSGDIASAPERRLRLMIGAQTFWLAIVCLLGAWWCRLVLTQASRIAELETSLGMVSEASLHQLRTGRMVFWESISYFLLLIGSTAVVFWLYWRDVQRSRGIQAFFASMTHELRTPLTSIRLQAESIAENLAGDASQKHLVERLLEDTLRMESQVERTLELARVEGGGPVFPEQLELKPWLDRLVAGWKESYGGKVRFEVSVADVAVVADPTAMGVVMRNLLENSVRHCKLDALEIRIEAAKSPDGVGLKFRDNGPGYAGDARKLGQIFQKGAGSPGTGVGLYLIRVLVEQMGGQAKFQAGRGFEVALTLREGRAHDRS
jgi:signal transduction histidine kinase